MISAHISVRMSCCLWKTLWSYSECLTGGKADPYLPSLQDELMLYCYLHACNTNSKPAGMQASSTQLQDLEAWYAEVTTCPNLVDKGDHKSRYGRQS